MDENINKKITELLNNPQAMQELSNIIGKFNSNQAVSESTTPNTEEIAQKAGQLINSLNSGNDRRINLLVALKPYLRQSRASNIDKAIQMLKITKLTDILKNERS